MIYPRMWVIALTVVAGMEAGPAAAQDVSLPGADVAAPIRDNLPFSQEPDRLSGPPRAMGELPQGFSQPPSTLPGYLFPNQPPRAMGETPVRSPSYPFFPLSTGTGGAAGLVGSSPMLSPSGATGGLPRDTRALPLFLPGAQPEGGAEGEGKGEGEAGELPPALEPGAGLLGARPSSPRAPQGPALRLDEVLFSTERKHPLFQATLLERLGADADILSARGSFDTNLNSDARNYPLGYYNRYLWDAFIEQPLFSSGGEFFAGYRLAQGKYPVYYNYLNTRGGGAFVSGLKMPLLKNRAIDGRRAKLFQTEIERRKVEPTILKERISLFKNASKAYWEWVAAGQVLMVTEQLVQSVEARYKGLEDLVASRTNVRPIDLESFRVSVIARQQQQVEARRRFQEATIELSLFLRDATGFPMLADFQRLPTEFPAAAPPDPAQIQNDLLVAMRLRPEILSLRLSTRKLEIERQYALNQMLPSLYLYIYTEQNVGDREKDLMGDFRPFILESSLLFDVPLQRRYARGRVLAADTELRQLAMQCRFATDRIRADVQEALALVTAAWEQVQLYRDYEQRYRRLEQAERELNASGLSTVLNVFIREQATADALIGRLNAEGKYHGALAEYRAAMGFDAVPTDLQVRPEPFVVHAGPAAGGEPSPPPPPPVEPVRSEL